jgi:hypothetical protein
MKVLRVFPRRTAATPDDDLVRVGVGPGLFDEADRVEISHTFSWDAPMVDWLYSQWRHVAPTEIGGPATLTPGGDFVPGRYVKRGYVITSRGCPNRNCNHCDVPQREGSLRELPITEGHNVLDDNLLACSEAHIRAVFAMLKTQRKVEFTGGLEAARLKPWHVDLLREVKPKQMFFAYDDPFDLEPLRQAGKMLLDAGFTTASHALRAYVLGGYTGDTIDAAGVRMAETLDAGFTPMAMVYRGKDGKRGREWIPWARQWIRPHIIHRSAAA